MKTRLALSIFLCVITLPALAALTPQDLDKIRLIVKDEIKSEITAVRQEITAVRQEITAVRQELKTDIAAVKQELKAEIASSEENIKESIHLEIGSVEKRLATYNWVIYILTPLIVAAIGIPTILMAWRIGKDRSLERQVEVLTSEIETLKQQQIANP